MSGPFIGTFDLSGFLAVPSSLKIKYQDDWNTYNRIQTVNSNISTLRSIGDKAQNYYTYSSYDELIAFQLGQYLHVQRYPNSNWNAVPKN